MADVAILIIKLLIVTGLRISELTTPRLSDDPPDGSQILMHDKGSKKRIVFVPNDLQREFRHLLEARCAQISSAALLFINAEGRPMRLATFRKRLRKLSTRLKIKPHLAPLRVRHSAATLLIEGGSDIRMVQALLGHANLRTTEIYVRASNHPLERALERAVILHALKQ
jgi:integrase/recombinase XerD